MYVFNQTNSHFALNKLNFTHNIFSNLKLEKKDILILFAKKKLNRFPLKEKFYILLVEFNLLVKTGKNFYQNYLRSFK